MFNLSILTKNEDYFKPAALRHDKGVLFCRFIGYDKNTLIFFRQLLEAAENSGAYIEKTLSNPSESQVSQFSKAVDLNHFRLDKPYLQNAVNIWLAVVPAPKRLQFVDALYEMVTLLAVQGDNKNIFKNMFVKWMCWGKNTFSSAISRAGDDALPKIIYEGTISKHEVYMLRILSRTGCDIAYINYHSDNSYLKADPASAFSIQVAGSHKGIPRVHFSEIDLTYLRRIEELKNSTKAVSDMLSTNTWIRGGITDEILKSNSARGALGNRIYNLYGRCFGIDKQDAYLARLYKLKESLIRSKKPLVMVENRLGNPTLDEVKAIDPITYKTKEELAAKLATAINLSSSGELASLICGSFMGTINSMDDSLQRLYNTGMKLLCWLARYTDDLFRSWTAENIPVFLYYGVCSESEAQFFNMLSAMPVDILIISPDKSAQDAFASLGKGDRGKEELLPDSMPLFPFPQSEPKVRTSTAAYDAARELDTLLYSDTGLFRSRQFTRCNPVTLRTTYDEIEILWKEEAKFRPGFEAGNGRVAVPNIFARICGVRDGDTNSYFKTIERMFTDKTIFIPAFPCLTPDKPNPLRDSVHKFFKDGSILPDKIKHHKDYPYDYLSEDTQDYVLEKIQQIIDLKWIKAGTLGIEFTILSVLLNLDKTTLRLIQQFDFTKDIPKVIIVHTDERMPSLEDCIYLAFLNLAGFDIAVFTPTGYRDLDKYLLRDAYEEHQIGTYLFHLQAPDMQPTGRSQQNSAPREGGLFGKLFGKG